jgi:hypothetical protein
MPCRVWGDFAFGGGRGAGTLDLADFFLAQTVDDTAPLRIRLPSKRTPGLEYLLEADSRFGGGGGALFPLHAAAANTVNLTTPSPYHLVRAYHRYNVLLCSLAMWVRPGLYGCVVRSPACPL